MTHARIWLFSWSALLLCGALSGCGKTHECRTDKDCTSTATLFVCQYDPSERRNRCTSGNLCGACWNDADCKSCGDRTTCRSNVCTKPAATCPATCTADTDCTGCGDQNTCREGRCQEVNPCNPGDCRDDVDCLRCGPAPQQCQQGTCVPYVPCPQSCRNDAECQSCPGGNNACVQGTCQKAVETCPSSCSTDQDCQKDACQEAKRCLEGRCQRPLQCPSTCNADADCTGCPSERQLCVRGRCAAPSTLGGPCTRDGDCLPGLICNAQQCAQSPTASTLEQCSGSRPCPQGDLCVGIGGSQQVGYCLTRCDPKAPNCKDADCLEVRNSGGIGVCLPGTAKRDQPCRATPGSYKLDINNFCDRGLRCARFTEDTTQGVCLTKVERCESTACSTGRTCVKTTNDLFVCAKTCAQDDECTTLSCKAHSTGPKICFPPPPKACTPAEYGQPCAANTEGNGLCKCKEGLLCVRKDTNTNTGYCTQDCAANQSCPEVRTADGHRIAGQCLNTSGRSLCVFPCNTNTPLCPQGLQCFPTGNQRNLCLAP